MKKITDIKDFPKGWLETGPKNTSLNLYKAFIVTDPDEKMEIKQSIDLLSTTLWGAVMQLMNTFSFDELDEIKRAKEKPIISIVCIVLDLEDLLKKDLVDEGDLYYENDILAITLKDKVFDVLVGDFYLTSFNWSADPKTEKRDYDFSMKAVNKKNATWIKEEK